MNIFVICVLSTKKVAFEGKTVANILRIQKKEKEKEKLRWVSLAIKTKLSQNSNFYDLLAIFFVTLNVTGQKGINI